jgi:hypothetical protein
MDVCFSHAPNAFATTSFASRLRRGFCQLMTESNTWTLGRLAVLATDEVWTLGREVADVVTAN